MVAATARKEEVTNHPFGSHDLRVLAYTPIEVVSRAFDGFVSPTTLKRYRGGFVVDKPTFLDKHLSTRDIKTYLPDYHRQSSFNPEQQRLVAATLFTLNQVALGIPPERGVYPVPQRYSVLVENCAQTDKPRNFFDALIKSDVKLLLQWSKLYGNLAPAMEAIFKAAGVPGMIKAAKDAKPFPGDAVTGLLDLNNIDQYRPELAAHSRFFRAREAAAPQYQEFGLPVVDDVSPRLFEVRCLGEIVAKTLTRESKFAALKLAGKNSKLVQPYDETPFIPAAEKELLYTVALIAAIERNKLAKRAFQDFLR